MVVQLGYHENIARPPAVAERPAQVKGQGRHVGAEDDLLGGSADPVGQGAAGGQQGSVGLAAARIGPVRVGVVVQQVVRDRLGDAARRLGATRTIEVGYRMAVVAPVQRRKVAANLLDGGNGVHGYLVADPAGHGCDTIAKGAAAGTRCAVTHVVCLGELRTPHLCSCQIAVGPGVRPGRSESP